jgi:hypothetical protein
MFEVFLGGTGRRRIRSISHKAGCPAYEIKGPRPSFLRRKVASGLAMASEGKGGWRCLAVEKLGQVELRAEAWHTEPRSSRQTCIDEIEFDADNQPAEHPQQGQ